MPTPTRLGVTGLSGGGWQTILLSSLDPRVKLAMPVAGYSSFVTRTQFPEMDLGDSEQTPVDLGRYADYTHLTAMVAPNPLQIANNARDNCCFRADYAQAPLMVAARPICEMYGESGAPALACQFRCRTQLRPGKPRGALPLPRRILPCRLRGGDSLRRRGPQTRRVACAAAGRQRVVP